MHSSNKRLARQLINTAKSVLAAPSLAPTRVTAGSKVCEQTDMVRIVGTVFSAKEELKHSLRSYKWTPELVSKMKIAINNLDILEYSLNGFEESDVEG